MAELRNTDNSKCWWDKDQMELLFMVAEIMNWHRYFPWKVDSTTTNLGIPHSPSNAALGYTLKNKSATRNMYNNGQSSTPLADKTTSSNPNSTTNRTVKQWSVYIAERYTAMEMENYCHT